MLLVPVFIWCLFDAERLFDFHIKAVKNCNCLARKGFT